jgi:hypothetical protein
MCRDPVRRLHVDRREKLTDAEFALQFGRFSPALEPRSGDAPPAGAPRTTSPATRASHPSTMVTFWANNDASACLGTWPFRAGVWARTRVAARL